jgi:DNA-binding transcriptional MerR regulator
MAKTSNLTPSQAAAVLTISASTLRRWSKDYTRHLSEDARGAGGHHRTYTPIDMAILKHAGELLKTHVPIEVDQLLGLADETQQTAALATLPTIAHELQAARDLISQLQADIADLKQADQDTRAEVARLVERQHKRSAAQQAEIESLRVEVLDLKTRRSWWQRLRKP